MFFKISIVNIEKRKKYTCEECDYETNIKKYFSKHTASSCLLLHFCEFCTESFERKSELNVHMRTSHTQTTNLKCDRCDFEALTKKFFNEHKASNCLITVSCDFACGKYFETEEQMTIHMKKVHKWWEYVKKKKYYKKLFNSLGARRIQTDHVYLAT